MTEVGFIVAFLAAPALILWAARFVPLAQRLGPIVLCYIGGLALGLSGWLPESATAPRTTATEVSLALALPLLLFSVDIRSWGRVAGRAMVSMLFAVIAVVAVATALFIVFSSRGVDQPEQLAGMAVGMYTGGIANLGAIKLALSIPDERYLLFATVDTVVGAVYLLFVLTTAPRLVSTFLKPFPKGATVSQDIEDNTDADKTRKTMIAGSLIALLCAAVCVGLAVALAPVFSFASPDIMVIVLLTTFGLAASLIPQVRDNRYATPIGMNLVYAFSFCVAAAMDLTALKDMDLSVLIFIVLATFGSLTLHALACRLAKIDGDTFLITSVAALMSPAFVPMVARSLGNPAILISGMTTGILGFAIGNYLGITIALMLAAI
ncbi:DUF819 family protein [Shimia thalassica]|uniref:DUF819 family protein n=1 Tax=Shimia thalassica TaxID=1715693 RepID=UPI0026E35413|nr:DUF819 family protein [Shimia thalassica]MDO6481032.1 DUF819 family protein [Shimia thalassica]